MNGFLRVCFAGLGILVLAGCSAGPSDSEVNDAVVQELQTPFMEITDIERVNGYEDGDKRYVVDASYVITFTESLSSLMETADEAERIMIGLFAFTIGEFEAGDRYEMQREFSFAETEQGWQIRD